MAQRTAASATPAPHEQILNIVMGFWQSRTLAVAAELELSDLTGRTQTAAGLKIEFRQNFVRVASNAVTYPY